MSKENEIELQEIIGEVKPGSYQPIRFSRVKYKNNPLTFIDIRKFQRQEIFAEDEEEEDKDVELQFGQDLTKLTEKVNQELADIQSKPETDDLRKRAMNIIQVSPKSAIVEVWRALETVIVDISTKSKIELDRDLLKKPIKLAETLLKEKLIDETQYAIIEDMRILRNKVVHYEKEQITAENAYEYLDSGIKLISSLKKK